KPQLRQYLWRLSQRQWVSERTRAGHHATRSRWRYDAAGAAAGMGRYDGERADAGGLSSANHQRVAERAVPDRCADQSLRLQPAAEYHRYAGPVSPVLRKCDAD